MALKFGVIPAGALVIERDAGSNVGWYDTPWEPVPCTCCGGVADPDYDGLATDEDGACHFCHYCAVAEGLAHD